MLSILGNSIIEDAVNGRFTWPDCEQANKNVKEEDFVPDDDDDFGDYEPRANLIWTAIATKTFLDFVQQMMPQLGLKFRTKKQMWAIIARKMEAKGFDFTQTQIENKWKDLYRSYRGHAEQLRRGKIKITSKTQIYTNWPDLFPLAEEHTTKRKSSNNTTITIKNDDSNIELDNPKADETFFEYCKTVTADETNDLKEEEEEEDPVYFQSKLKKESDSGDNTRQPSPQHMYETPPIISHCNMALHRIADELASYRQESLKLEREKIKMKKLQLEAYKERTTEISKVGKGFTDLLFYLKRKTPDDNDE